jgi:hypothetical protein
MWDPQHLKTYRSPQPVTGIALLLLFTVLVGPCPLLSFLILYAVGRTPLWGISQTQSLYLHTRQHRRKINEQHKTTTLRVGFEPTIQAFQRAKTVHALDREANVTEYEEEGRSRGLT